MSNEIDIQKHLADLPLKELYIAYDAAFSRAWNEYVELHKELDRYRGKDLTDELVLIVNPIISAIQDKFIELHPAINNIIQRYQMCARSLQDYESFMKDLKQTGAEPANEAQA